MLTALIFIIPALASALMFLPWKKLREWTAVLAAILVVGVLTVFKLCSLIYRGGIWNEINSLDRLSFITLAIVAVVGLTSILYSIGYLKLSANRYDLSNRKHLQYFELVILFYAAMLWVPLAHNVIWLWALIEATSLAAVFLVDFEKTTKTFEATWKYIVMMEIGGATSLLGILIILFGSADGGRSITWDLLMKNGPMASAIWLRLGFTLILVGFGIKAGLVPMHTWLPDAHSQAPSPVSAMMSGIKINVALYGILRFYDIMVANGQQDFASLLLRLTGFLTIIVAVAMTTVQKDYKRLFAYSSTENMGIIILGYTLGPLGVYGAMLQMLNHAIIKPGLFYLSGNLIINHGSTEIRKVRGVFHSMKWSGLILILLMLAIAGAPPFGLFISEFLILLSMLHDGFIWMGIILAILLVILFANFLRYALNMVFGRPTPKNGMEVTGSWQTILPPFFHLVASLALGMAIPVFLQQLLYFGR